MLKKVLLSMALISSVSFAKDFTEIQYVDNPNKPHKVFISLKEISRIVCPIPITSEPVYSKEKDIVLKKAGENVFVKIIPKKYLDQKTGEVLKIEYPIGNREAFVKCGNDIYTLILVPQDGISSQTIYLNTKVKKVKEVQEFEKANDYEKTLNNLIKLAYLEKLPRGYKVETRPKVKKDFAELSLELRKKYIGYYYVIEEYKITPKTNIEVDEALFIPYIDGQIKALSLENFKLIKGKETRLFVVKQNQY